MRIQPLVVLTLSAAVAEAAVAAPRAFVASFGSDAATCSVVSPCRSFGAAIGVVDSGGEVIALDSAGYGPVTITKSVRLVAPAGVHAAISVPTSGDGILVTSGNLDVTIRGLSILGNPGAQYGIRALNSGAIKVDRVTIEGVATGILVDSASTTNIEVRDVVLTRGSSAIVANHANGTIVDVVADNFTSDAIEIGNGSVISVARAIVSNVLGNGTSAIAVAASGGANAQATIVDCRITNVFGGITAAEFGGTAFVEAIGNTVLVANASGIAAQSPGATLFASRNSVTRSNIGLAAVAGGTLKSFGDNTVAQNTADTSGLIQSATLH